MKVIMIRDLCLGLDMQVRVKYRFQKEVRVRVSGRG